jgi:hypothetical protein
MSRVLATLLLGGSLALSGLAVSPALATPLYADGQQQSIKGADDFFATVLGYLYMPGLPFFGTLLALSGLGNLGEERGTKKGITKIGSGVGAGFVPALIKPGSDYANGAAGFVLPVAAWPEVVGLLLMQALLLTLLYAWYRRTHVA